MRVVSGIYKGRQLCTPKGRDTRPTTDRNKESMMSSIFSIYGPADGTVVLDAFAGSGGLGIEMLSRGSSMVVFCDRDREACESIRKNLNDLGVSRSSYALNRTDVLKTTPSARNPFDIVLLDPPYALQQSEVSRLVKALSETGMLAEMCLVVYEHGGKTSSEEMMAALGSSARLVRTKSHGETVVDYIVIGNEGEND